MIEEVTPLQASANSTVSNCEANDGTITVSVTGGIAPYTYTINGNTSTSNTFAGLAAGAYTVSVEDANNCATSVAVTVGETNCLINLAVDVEVIDFQEIYEVGDTIVVAVTVSNTGPIDATGVEVNYELPDGTQVVSSTDSSFDINTGTWNVNEVNVNEPMTVFVTLVVACLLYTSPSPRDATLSRMPSSA